MITSRSDILAWDIGGAAIKAADGRGWSHAESFPLWRSAAELPTILERIAADRRPRRLVTTMTGEIADCYADRAAGVRHIVSAASAAARAVGCPLPEVYLVDGRLVAPEIACGRPLAAAASNWHALARLAALLADTDRGLLLDVGSTTTDIVACDRRGPRPLSSDDAGRMASGELVYTGVERTPLAAVVRHLPHAGLARPVAAERFADTRDAWLLLDGVPEEPLNLDTADGRPATVAAAIARIARSMLLDPGDVTRDEAVRCARAVADAQADLVVGALEGVVRRHGWTPDVVVLSGHGTALAHAALDRVGWQTRRLSLGELLGPAVSRSAPAHALALIASGELP